MFRSETRIHRPQSALFGCMATAMQKKYPVQPMMAQRGPFIVNVKAGCEYVWCSCGRSQAQPWCDGSHLGTGLEPITFVAPVTAEFYMCGCKKSDNKPYCFGNCRE